VSFVDFHCHLDLYPDFEAAVRIAEAAQVYTLAVTTTPRAWPRNEELTRGTKFIRAALGLHPQLVAQHPKDIDIWEKYVDQSRFVGEVGMDAGPRFYRSLDSQKEVFEHVLRRCALGSPKVLTIHSVRAAKAVLDRLERFLPPKDHSIVLHWFTGSVSDLKRAVEMGCFFSVNSQMVSSERGNILVTQIPLDRLLTETDGPFTRCLGRPSCPADVSQTVQQIAAIRALAPDQVGAQVLQNLRRIISPANKK
jgi:TatD DNase family protein